MLIIKPDRRATRGPWHYVQTMMARFLRIIGLLGCACFFALPAAAQRDRGELQIEVHDPQGAVLGASGELVSQGNQFHLEFTIGDDGRFAAQDLAFGVYRLSVSHSGFVPAVQLVEIRSIVPQHLSLTLGLKAIETQVQVSETETLVDTTRTSEVYTVGAQTIAEQLSPQAGRGVIDVVDTQPGWLQEANGVLHPGAKEWTSAQTSSWREPDSRGPSGEIENSQEVGKTGSFPAA